MRTTLIAALLAVTSLSLTTGCEPKTDDGDIEWLETSASAMEIISKPRGAFGVKGTPRTAWLDPRPEAEFKAERIAGAIHLPLGRIDSEHMVALKEKDLIIVYDAETDNAIAMAAAKKLLALGYRDVYVLRGGLKVWKRDGNSTDKG
jgi:rhodanese-related sulfurtransferase